MIRITLVLVLIAACGTRNTELGNCSLGNEGAACTTGAECCSNDCAGGSCGAVGACTSNGEACTDGQACCSGSCEAGACAPTECQASGSSCAGGEDCCSGRCQGDTCLPNNSCLAPDVDCDPAAADACCSGRCEPVQGMAGVTRCTGICRGNGASCAKATDCCDLNCNGGTCGGEICKVQSDDCVTNAECCSNICGPITSASSIPRTPRAAASARPATRARRWAAARWSATRASIRRAATLPRACAPVRTRRARRMPIAATASAIQGRTCARRRAFRPRVPARSTPIAAAACAPTASVRPRLIASRSARAAPPTRIAVLASASPASATSFSNPWRPR
jgi:hypothetical protein